MSAMPLQASPASDRIAILSRKPRRVTITIHWQLHQRLLARADQEGRALSNLMAHLLEVALER